MQKTVALRAAIFQTTIAKKPQGGCSNTPQMGAGLSAA